MQAAAAANACGLLVIISLPIGDFLCAAASLIWLLFGSAEMLLISSVHNRFGRILLRCDGSVQLHDRSGQWQAATIQSGTVVLPRLAWLRLKTANGRRYRELVCGKSSESEQWRRLQVIWRHLGAAS